MSEARTLHQWVAMADAAIAEMEADADHSKAMKANAYVLRAQLAMQLATATPRTVEALEKLLVGHYRGVYRVVPMADGTGMLIALAMSAPIGWQSEDIAKMWQETGPWRDAGWRIDFHLVGRERCPSDQNSKATSRHTEEHDLIEWPWCKYCGSVVP